MLMIRSMVMENLFGLMVDLIKETGKEVNSMEREYI